MSSPDIALDLAAGTAAHAIDRRRERQADTALRRSGVAWFVVAVIGQLLFASYIAGFYGRATLLGRPDWWNKVMPHGYVAGDAFGNIVVGLHLLFAVVIILGGALQLLSQVRRRWPRFHRWNGRVYLGAAAVMSLGGLVMVWRRGTVGDLSQHIAISINALCILGCAGMALYHAIARRIDAHRRWALRLFLVVSGVWFFRVGLMFWIVANQGPAGFDADTFTGPFLTFLAFAQYLVPLAVLEAYFHVRDRAGVAARFAMAGAMCVLTLATAGGIAAATALMWLPRL